MKIASAQLRPSDGDIEKNISHHLYLAELAADKGARLIVFPEMSLTGYQRENAHQLAFIENDLRLEQLRALARSKNTIIMAGAPIHLKSGLHIGAFILLPDGTNLIYTKQFLHQNEELYFIPSFGHNPVLELENETIAFAICADISHPAHPAMAAQNKATLYIASIFYTPNGIAKGLEDLGNYSRHYSMKVLMSNYTGASYQLAAGAKAHSGPAPGNLRPSWTRKKVSLSPTSILMFVTSMTQIQTLF